MFSLFSAGLSVLTLELSFPLCMSSFRQTPVFYQVWLGIHIGS
jgi:hypothetical protein